jgi:hypothetical protein
VRANGWGRTHSGPKRWVGEAVSLGVKVGIAAGPGPAAATPFKFLAGEGILKGKETGTLPSVHLAGTSESRLLLKEGLVAHMHAWFGACGCCGVVRGVQEGR